jgi:hypothetical protein
MLHECYQMSAICIRFDAVEGDVTCCDLQNKWEFSNGFQRLFAPVYYWDSVEAIPIYFASRSKTFKQHIKNARQIRNSIQQIQKRVCCKHFRFFLGLKEALMDVQEAARERDAYQRSTTV